MEHFFRPLLGLGGEKNARAVQLAWLLAGPYLAILSAFALAWLSEDFCLVSWLLLGILAAGFFWDGRQGWRWARRRLWALAGYILVAYAGLAGYLPDSLLLQYAILPLVWPITLAGLIGGLVNGSDLLVAKTVLGTWLTLFLSYWAGEWVRRDDEAARKKQTEEGLPGDGEKNGIAGAGENHYNSKSLFRISKCAERTGIFSSCKAQKRSPAFMAYKFL